MSLVAAVYGDENTDVGSVFPQFRLPLRLKTVVGNGEFHRSLHSGLAVYKATGLGGGGDGRDFEAFRDEISGGQIDEFVLCRRIGLDECLAFDRILGFCVDAETEKIGFQVIGGAVDLIDEFSSGNCIVGDGHLQGDMVVGEDESLPVNCRLDFGNEVGCLKRVLCECGRKTETKP